MYWDYGKRVQAGDIANSIAMYLSERNIGPFKDAFITFNQYPELHVLHGSLYDRLKQISQAPVGGNTNVEAVFELILRKATESNLPQSDMPQTIIILSDMQFDSCVKNPNQTAMQMIKSKYAGAGYEVPKVIFWNLRNSVGVPAKHNETGTILVSGYSPSLMKEVLGAVTPLEMVMKIINSERYERITL